MAQPVQRIEVDAAELASIVEHAKPGLSEGEYQKLRGALDTLVFLTGMLEAGRTSLRALRDLVFGSSSEKTKDILANCKPASPSAGADREPGPASEPEKAKAKGHGRNSAEDYGAAQRVPVPHPSLKPKDPCPECPKGKVYPLPPAQIVRVVGQAPLCATVYELSRLRCNLCGAVFTAPEPDGNKYDATAGSMIALLKYGCGVPFNRLDTLQGDLEAPLPSSTQWEIVRDLAKDLDPLHQELIGQAAEGEVLHNDDTGMKILEMMKAQREQEARGDPPERTGIFTSGIVSTAEGQRIALFFTGRKHAGENLADVLARRKSAETPIQMCDGLSRNLPDEMKTVLGNCLAHGRRQFVDLVEVYPDEVQHLLMEIGTVYANDAEAKNSGLSPEARLRFHKEKSAPIMKDLKRWMKGLLDEKRVEPNASMGKAIQYMLKRWENLTLFLRKAGAPLDNNLCERMLKKAILNRKNAYFYKTENGARVGDLFMSLIATCQLTHVNPFEYLTELQRNIHQVQRTPARWLPWNYAAAMPTATHA
jgi:transposase